MVTIVARRYEEPYPTSWTGINIYKSSRSRKCQLCGNHKSKYRRQCPRCLRLVAPGCRPILCWKDGINRCRDCHAAIRTLKFYRYLQQETHDNTRRTTFTIQSNLFTYLDLPVGLQIRILVFTFRPQDFIWARSEINHLLSLSASSNT